MTLLAKQYGGIFQLNIIGTCSMLAMRRECEFKDLLTCPDHPLGLKLIMLNEYEYLNELSDETRFKKSVTGPLVEVRNAAGDGLFTVSGKSSVSTYVSPLNRLRCSRPMFRESRTGILHVWSHLLSHRTSVHPLTNVIILDRLLMPCFGTANVYKMFDGMMDITSQLILKWQRCVASASYPSLYPPN